MAELARPTLANTMSRPVDELIQSIKDDFEAARQTPEELEAKSLFRLLNYCPPSTSGMGTLPSVPSHKSKI
jgi:hypothetical protein